MNEAIKKLSNPTSTGGAGSHFEAHVQASYVVLMLTGGRAPCLPCSPITKIKLQGKVKGYDTDDLIVEVRDLHKKEKHQLLGQIKLAVSITSSDKQFKEFMQAAWSDFNNDKIFTKHNDKVALIVGALGSKSDYQDVIWLLEHARCIHSTEDFFTDVEQANFSSDTKRNKLKIIRDQLNQANGGTAVSDKETHSFLQHLYILIYDLGKEDGVILSLLHSHISQFNQKDVRFTWSRICDFVQHLNKHAGVIIPDKIPEDIKEKFKQKDLKHIPEELDLSTPDSTEIDVNESPNAAAIALINFIGAWNGSNEDDIAAISDMIGKL